MLIIVDDIIIDAVGDKLRESLIADALVPIFIVGFIDASAVSLEGFAMSGRDFYFSLTVSSWVGGRVSMISITCA